MICWFVCDVFPKEDILLALTPYESEEMRDQKSFTFLVIDLGLFKVRTKELTNLAVLEDNYRLTN